MTINSDYVFLDCNTIFTINIHENSKSIRVSSYDGCNLMERFYLPYVIFSIPDYAFYCCHAISKFQIPDTVTSIGYFVIHGCNLILSLTMSPNVESRGKYAIRNARWGLEMNESNLHFSKKIM